MIWNVMNLILKQIKLLTKNKNYERIKIIKLRFIRH